MGSSVSTVNNEVVPGPCVASEPTSIANMRRVIDYYPAILILPDSETSGPESPHESEYESAPQKLRRRSQIGRELSAN